MSIEVVTIPGRKLAITGVTLPELVPTRVYIHDHEYAIVAPRVPLPPILNVVKFILKWATVGGTLAKNIGFLKTAGGTGSTSDPTFLSAVADQIMSTWVTSAFASSISTDWTLTGVECHDAGGTSAVGVSTHTPIPGLVAPPTLPPQSAVALSWQIAESYRGGKPRWYLPGIPQSAQSSSSGALILSSYANSLASGGNFFLSHMNSALVSGTSLTLGTVSYHTAHAVRPTPLFRSFLHCKVHERLDSQRRRSGKELTYPVTP